jgi:hypothetical protein
MAIISLITDFGLRDAYVGIMKGVILGINPKAQIVDLTHEIRPQSIKEAAFVLRGAYHFFPSGTIHIVVIDPGVGSKRRPLLVQTPNYFFLAPDNGVLELIYQNESVEVFYLSNKKYFLPNISTTFHGRDIFAPVAGYISLGRAAKGMGAKIKNYKRLKWPLAEVKSNKIIGKIIYIDRFGNLISNISKKQFDDFTENHLFTIKIKKIVLKSIAPSYLSVSAGEILAIWGSSGYLEIAQSMGSAKGELKANIGQSITINRLN